MNCPKPGELWCDKNENWYVVLNILSTKVYFMELPDTPHYCIWKLDKDEFIKIFYREDPEANYSEAKTYPGRAVGSG